MPFKDAYKAWIARVQGNRCAYEFYTEKRGFDQCPFSVSHIHHPVAEKFLLARGEDPEHKYPGIGLCKHHHVGDPVGDNEEHSFKFTFHPDAGQAFGHYKGYKEEFSRVKRVLGIHAARTIKSPFQEMSEHHAKLAANGERYWAGTPEIERHMIERQNERIHKYVALHPEDKAPKRKPHPQYNPDKKKHWWDEFFGK